MNLELNTVSSFQHGRKFMLYSDAEALSEHISYTEVTVARFVFTTSVFCLRKPEAVRKTTTELLAAVLSNIILCQYVLH